MRWRRWRCSRWRRLPYLDYFKEVEPMLYLVYLGLHPAVVNEQSIKLKYQAVQRQLRLGSGELVMFFPTH